MVNEWEQVLQEVHPQAKQITDANGWAKSSLEFLTTDVITPDELVTKAKAIIEQDFYIVDVTLYKPAGVETSRRWSAEIVISPKVYVDIRAQVDALLASLYDSGLLYRAQNALWDCMTQTPGKIGNTIIDLVTIIPQMINMIVIVLMMSMMMPMMSSMTSSSEG